MTLGTILLIALIILLLGSAPMTGWHSYGWGPSGGIGLVLVVVLILIFLGRI